MPPSRGQFSTLNITDMRLDLKRPIVFFDLETTGLSTTKDRVIEISVTKFSPNEKPITKTRKINPGMPIPDGATAVNGITDDDVKDAPKFSDVAKSLAAFMKDSDIAGYNILRFDIPILREEFLRCGIDWPFRDTKIVDVYLLVCGVLPRNLGKMYSLVTGHEPENAHNAEYDTKMTIDVLGKLLDNRAFIVTPFTYIKGRDVETLHNQCMEDFSHHVDYAGKIIVDKAGDYLFNFGAHKGEKVLHNRNYCKWMLTADFTEDTKMALMAIWERSKYENLDV